MDFRLEPRTKVRTLVLLALFTALSVVLSVAESFLSPLFPVPGAKLGLSHIVTMVVFFGFGAWGSAAVIVLKGMFILMSRGLIAFTLSVFGGLAAVCVMAFLYRLFAKKISILLLSVLGAVTHNLSQLAAIRILYDMDLFRYYLPLLVVVGVFSGAVTAYLYRLVYLLLRRNL